MIPVLGYAILAAGLVLALWTGIQAARRRPTSEAQMIGAIVVEVALLVQVVIALIQLFGGHDADRVDPPLPYPASCRPQAWAAASAVPIAQALELL